MAGFGVDTIAGMRDRLRSDNGYRSGAATVYDELITDVKYGMEPRKALQAATTEAAARLGFNKLGTLAPGMEGDLVAVEGDPLTDIQAVKRIRFVLFEGSIVNDGTDKTNYRPPKIA